MNIEIDSMDFETIPQAVDAKPGQIKLAHKRALRVAHRKALTAAKRLMRDHVDAKSLKTVKIRFYEKRSMQNGMVSGRIWVGYNPISIVNLRGRKKETKGQGVTFRGKTWAKGFIVRLGPKRKAIPFQRVGGKWVTLKMDIAKELPPEISSALNKIIPEAYTKEFTRDLIARAEGKVGKK